MIKNPFKNSRIWNLIWANPNKIFHKKIFKLDLGYAADRQTNVHRGKQVITAYSALLPDFKQYTSTCKQLTLTRPS